MIDDSVREDFESAIRGKGYDPSDFELTENQNPPEGTEMYAVTGTVTIKRRSNGKEKSYKAGHGSTWPAEFSDDLDRGVFG